MVHHRLPTQPQRSASPWRHRFRSPILIDQVATTPVLHTLNCPLPSCLSSHQTYVWWVIHHPLGQTKETMPDVVFRRIFVTRSLTIRLWRFTFWNPHFLVSIVFFSAEFRLLLVSGFRRVLSSVNALLTAPSYLFCTFRHSMRSHWPGFPVFHGGLLNRFTFFPFKFKG